MKQLFTFLICVTAYTTIKAQTFDDYRTIASGGWIAPAIWQRFDGTNWVAATTAPTSANETITIRNGHNVTVNDTRTIDQTVIETGASIIISSASGNLTIADGTGDDLIINGNFSLTLGTLQGSGTVHVNTGSLSWNSGWLTSVTVNIAETGALNMAGYNKPINSATINNYGTIAWSAGNLQLYYSAKLNNYGSLTLSGNAGIQGTGYEYSASSTFANKNTGTITRLGGGTSILNPGNTAYTLVNEGVVHVRAGGVLELRRNGNHSGIFNVENTGVLKIADVGQTINLNEGTAFTGLGTVEMAGNVSINHVIGIEGITFYQKQGAIHGNGTLNFNGNSTYNWVGGGLYHYVTVNIGATAILNMSETNSYIRDITGYAVLNNYGTVNWTAGNLYFNAIAPQLNNYATFMLSNDVNIITFNFESAIPVFNNKSTGTLIGSEGVSDFSFADNVILSNEGIISGTGVININSGIFINTGVISPGMSPGVLTLNGLQPLTANSVLEIEMQDDSGAGTGHDQLLRDGNLTLAGTLNVIETGSVSEGVYNIIELSSGSISGSFSNVNLPEGYALVVNDNTVQLIVSTLSVNSVTANDFKIFPNPATTQITIKTPIGINISQLSIYDVNGRLVNTITYNGHQDVVVDVSALLPAMYIMHLINDKGHRMYKSFIKKR